MTRDEYIFEPSAPPPWAHQAQAVKVYGDHRILALNFSTRTGKSRSAIDVAAYRYERGDINALLIIAYPNGVPRNWIENEIPVYLPQRIPRLTALWRAGIYKNRMFNYKFDNLLKTNSLAIFAINAEALSGAGAAVKKYITRFLAVRKVFLVIDECDAFSAPNSGRSRTMMRIAHHNNIIAKRILSATIITETPFDAYNQYALLDRRIIDCPTYLSFKHRYGEYVSEYDPTVGQTVIKQFYNHTTKSYFENLAKDENGRPKYRNLDDLQRRIAPYTIRVRREDVSDAPQKLYQIRYFQLADDQRRIYNSLRDEYRAELANGAVWTAREAIVRLTRLQQIASNFLPERQDALPCKQCQGAGCDDCEGVGIVLTTTPLTKLAATNQRLEALKAELATEPGSAIIWCRFTAEVDEVVAALAPNVVRYDGKISERERAKGLAAYQASEVQYLVGNQQAGGRGVRMDRASLMVYMSNNWSSRSRIQSEDRAEAIDKKYATGIVDLVAEDTVDETLIQALRAKRDMQALINGDKLKEWL